MTASVLRLKNVARVGGGQSPPSDEVTTFEGEGLPFLQGNAEFGSDHPRPRNRCDAPPRVAPAGSILMSVRAPVGALNWADRDYGIGRGLCSIVPTKGEARYVWWALQAAVPALRSVATGSTFEAVAVEDVAGVFLPAHDERVQRRITDFLDYETARIDALIAAKQRMVDGLIASRMDTMRAGVAGEVVSGDRSKASLAWLPELPTHWGMAKLTLLARLGSGHTPSRSRPEWWMNPTIPWITTGEVAQMRSDRIELILETREMISELGMANSSAELHPAGTVVLCRTASAGYSAIMGGPMAVSQDFATWTCGPHLDPRFLLLCLRAMRRDLLERLAMGSTHKTIYMPDIESIRVPVPPMDEQHRLVEWVWSRLRRIDAIVDTLTAQIALLRERRQALITAAVTGEIEV